ncbi:hypothetical protein [Marinobacter sp. AN1]|uniref:hypothetical protein n=1 Tax=Marinobacter sp. AN1 TaxID=2886046 RepID=UPI0022310DD6|nr:hypothetical protein [Marinobacter sp. AN1]UZD66739.1 hypothetical protein LJ360_05175 [Marinobacter sp. AN1]
MCWLSWLSSEELVLWLDELNAARPPVAALPINDVVSGLPVEGPFPAMAEAIRQLH